MLLLERSSRSRNFMFWRASGIWVNPLLARSRRVSLEAFWIVGWSMYARSGLLVIRSVVRFGKELNSAGNRDNPLFETIIVRRDGSPGQHEGKMCCLSTRLSLLLKLRASSLFNEHRAVGTMNIFEYSI